MDAKVLFIVYRGDETCLMLSPDKKNFVPAEFDTYELAEQYLMECIAKMPADLLCGGNDLSIKKVFRPVRKTD